MTKNFLYNNIIPIKGGFYMLAKKGFSEEQIAERFNIFKNKYQSRYSQDLWNYIEENFWLYVFSSCAPDVLMQVYSEIGLVHEKGDFYDEHIKRIKERFDIGCNIIDIGSGVIPSFANKLAYEQLKIGKGTITLYEPLLIDSKPKYSNMTLHREDFTLHTNIKEFNLVTGIMPCEVTETIIEQACQERKDFYIAMCGCVHVDNYMPFMSISPESYQRYIIEKTASLLRKYDNGQLEVDSLGPEFEIDYPILSNRR